MISSVRTPDWIGWSPILILTAAAICLKGYLPSWEIMWMLSFAIFFGFKWWTWWRVIRYGVSINALSLAYLFLWPGMDARRFLGCPWSKKPTSASWTWALSKTLFGAGLIWYVARLAGHGLLAGWIGMIGLIMLLHFGSFALLSLFWQGLGIYAHPLMNHPIEANSLTDFWGKRWNSGFRDIVFGLFFVRIAKHFRVIPAAIITFVLSGLIHELVITFPTGAGYGLPTFYFTIQAIAMLLERSPVGRRLGLAHGWRGRVFALFVVIVPVFALFPSPFVLQVMIPFLQAIKSLT